MRKILFTFAILILSFSIIRAQDTLSEPEYEDVPVTSTDEENRSSSSVNSSFDLELVRDSQNALNKKITYTLYITPKIESGKTQILWNIPSVFTVETNHKEFVSLRKDVTYTFKATLTPNRPGAYDISASVISWQYDTNRTNSVSSLLELNKRLIVQPVDATYALSLTSIIGGIIIGVGVALFTIVWAIKTGINKLKNWLKPPF